MNNNVLFLYDLMEENLDSVNEIIAMSEESFLNNEDCLNYGYGLVSKIRELFLKINNEILFVNKTLSNISKEMHVLDEKVINEYKYINGYMVYDFLKIEYPLILEELNKILKI